MASSLANILAMLYERLKFEAGCQGFIPEILATQEVEIVKTAV
jgi:hypothetical protein